MRTCFTLLLLLLAAPLHAQTVTLPAELKVPAGRLVALAIEYDGDDIRWAMPAELDSFREYDPDPKKIHLRIMALPETKAGRYALIAVTVKEGKLSPFAVCYLLVGGVPPVPPPMPPPDPPPPPPPPVDPLAGLQAAYDAEPDQQKAAVKGRLAALYRAMATVAQDQGTTTWGALQTAFTAEYARQAVEGKLPAVRAVLTGYFRTRLPGAEAKNTPLDAAARQGAVVAFTAAATALEGVK